jgi:hypothetical protein
LGEPRAFQLTPLFTGGLIAEDRAAVLEFELRTASLYRAITGTDRAAEEVEQRIDHLLRAVLETPAAGESEGAALRGLKARMQLLRVKLNGDKTLTSRLEPAPLDLLSRVGFIVGGGWESQSAVPASYRASLGTASEQYQAVAAELKSIAAELENLESELGALGAPWTPARIPDVSDP